MSLFSNWNKIHRRCSEQPTAPILERQREWLGVLHLLEKIYEELHEDFFSKIGIIYNSKGNGGEFQATNYGHSFISILPQETNIAITANWAEPPRHAYENGGAILIKQLSSGKISIFFSPSKVILPYLRNTDIQVSYFERNNEGQYDEAIVTPHASIKFILYGCYEPWELTEPALRKIISRGLCFILDTREGANPSLYTHYLLNKDDKFYRGLFWGFLLSILTSASWDGIKWIWGQLWQ